MKGIMERCERAIRHRADGELEDTRAEFWTKSAAVINKAKSCKLGEKRDTKNIRRDQE